MDTIRDMIAAQRAELAEVLAGLPAPSWDEPTLCAGWRVREVVAHITMPFRYGRGRFGLELAKSRGRFNEMADRVARRDAAGMSPADLTGAVRSNVGHPWKPPGGGFTGALAHDLIHGLDITVPLGLDRPVPEERLRPVLPGSLADRSVRFFGVDLDGIELRAADMDWTLGSGTPLEGTAADLLLVLSGRTLPPGRLTGEPGARFTQPA
ncbi:MAG TPA: maleylpyruvate isomerase family mycothiol-dependent enzyme [Streptosporangiaceae bacterium]|nr:maleylpyruvate isomerase family mycothiol-dependent enzyme [Streptosporangiaceae bacterium]